MSVQSFEDLNVWKRARELVNIIYKITKNKKFFQDKGLVDQIRRAAVSILSNIVKMLRISEGFERGSNSEFIQFLYIAKASCGEVRCQIIIVFDQGISMKKKLQRLKS